MVKPHTDPVRCRPWLCADAEPRLSLPRCPAAPPVEDFSQIPGVSPHPRHGDQAALHDLAGESPALARGPVPARGRRVLIPNGSTLHQPRAHVGTGSSAPTPAAATVQQGRFLRGETVQAAERKGLSGAGASVLSFWHLMATRGGKTAQQELM